MVVLSASALGSTYAGYQEGLWDGEQASHYALAAKAQTAAASERTLAMQRESVNALHFTQWLNAFAAGNSELELFYRERFRPEFRKAFDAWMATRPRLDPSSPPTPFDIPGYRARSTAPAERFEAQAAGHLRSADRDTRASDAYGQSVVIFALALFLGGIVQGFESNRTRLVLVTLAALACLVALALLVDLPALRPA